MYSFTTTQMEHTTACSSCGARNRIPLKHLSRQGRCGACKNALPPVGEPIETDSASFDAIVSASRVPVLVDFWASWCGPCRMVAPEVHKLAQELAGKALFLKVNTEEHADLAARFAVQAIPYFVVFRDGKAVFQQAGAVPRSEMRRWLERA